MFNAFTHLEALPSAAVPFVMDGVCFFVKEGGEWEELGEMDTDDFEEFLARH